MEIWKDVIGYEGLYKVSNLGRVKSVGDNGKATHRIEHILKQSACRGYKHVGLCKNGRMKTYSVHRLVAFAFIDKPEGKNFIDHINTIRDDNRVENLRWCTEKENNNNPITRKNKSESKRGNKNPNFGKDMADKIQALARMNSKCVVQYTLNGEVVSIFPSAKEASIQTGIVASNINRACRKERYTAGGYVWEFLSPHS